MINSLKNVVYFYILNYDKLCITQVAYRWAVTTKMEFEE